MIAWLRNEYKDFTFGEFAGDLLKLMGWLILLGVVLGVAKGNWDLFWWVTAPITIPLFLIYILFDSGTIVITPMAIVIGLLFMIWLKLDTRK